MNYSGKILPLIIAPDPLLKRVSDQIEKVDNEIRQLMDDMISTMYKENGIGLSAVQIGILKRVLVIDVSYKLEDCDGDHDHHNHSHDIYDQVPIFMANPQLIKSAKENSVYNEGCLSFPEIRAQIERPKEVVIKYLDYNNEEKILEATGLLATCVQHEIDHLNGIVFLDHLSKLKKEMIMKKIVKKNKIS